MNKCKQNPDGGIFIIQNMHKNIPENLLTLSILILLLFFICDWTNQEIKIEQVFAYLTALVQLLWSLNNSGRTRR